MDTTAQGSRAPPGRSGAGGGHAPWACPQPAERSAGGAGAIAGAAGATLFRRKLSPKKSSQGVALPRPAGYTVLIKGEESPPPQPAPEGHDAMGYTYLRTSPFTPEQQGDVREGDSVLIGDSLRLDYVTRDCAGGWYGLNLAEDGRSIDFRLSEVSGIIPKK